MRRNQQLKMQHGKWRNNDVTELQIMLSSMSEECKQRIMDKADRLEAFFPKDDVLYMKDKEKNGVNGMLPEAKTTKEISNEKY